MCNFFSFVVDPRDNGIYYFDADARRNIKLKNKYDLDSHTSICHYFKLSEDRVNKYEYVPRNEGWLLIEDEIYDHSICYSDISHKMINLAARKDFKEICSAAIDNGNERLPIEYYTDKQIIKMANNLYMNQIKNVPKKFWNNKKFLKNYFKNTFNAFENAPCISKETKIKAMSSESYWNFVTSYLKKRWGIHA